MYKGYKNRIFGLDVIRAIAIILVMVSHSTFLLFPNEANFALTLIRFFGAIGVDLFFVLSGFLIGTIILKQLNAGKTKFNDFAYFWVRRWFRTLPNYFLILLVNILLFYAFHGVIIENVTRFFIFTQNFFNPHPNFFTEAWSLSIEEYAYIIGPLLLFVLIKCLKRTSKDRLFLIVTIGVILFIAACRLYHHFTNNLTEIYDWSKEVRKVVVFRIDSIYYGFLAAFISINYNWWKLYKWKLFYSGIVVFFGVHALVFVFQLEPYNASFFYDVIYLPIVSLSILLLFPVFIYWEKYQVFKSQIVTISKLSYALYLVNYSIVLLSIQYFVDVNNQSLIIKVLIFKAYWLVSFLLSFLLYKYFERPIMDIRDAKFIRKKLHK